MTITLGRADARHLPLPDESVDLIITSPPYFGLRSYTDGGEHYAGQIGSEATPAQYVAALLECTREWVRVLKPSGSMFINLGDSYASQPAGKPGRNGQVSARNPAEAHAARRGERQRRPTGGRQFTREDAAWLAGVVDSDGSISIRINRQPEGNAPSFVPWVRVGQMRPEVVTRIAELVGTGTVTQDTRGVWSWTAAAQQARWALERIHPWLLIKKRQAWAAVEVARHVEDRNARGAWRPLTADDIAYRQRLRDAVLAWNQGRPDDMPVPEPRPVALPVYPLAPRAKSLLDLPHQYAQECVGRLGLIKRAEIWWSKPNGLPESVQDRVRRSHEFLFHFTRQPRYYSAVDEVREPHSPDTHSGRTRTVTSQSGNGITHRTYAGNTDSFNPLGKLPGSVWEIPSQPLTVPACRLVIGGRTVRWFMTWREGYAHMRRLARYGWAGPGRPSLRPEIDHFAAFPMELPRRVIAGWSPPGICTACGEGRRPVVDRHNRPLQRVYNGTLTRVPGDGREDYRRGVPQVTEAAITGYACACPQPDAPTRPSVIADPFGGTGTTALVADALGRHGLSFDRSADYCRLSRWRTTNPGERAKAAQVTPPPPRHRPAPDQPTMF